MKTKEILLGEITFQENTIVKPSFKIPVSFPISRFKLRVQGTLTNAGYTTPPSVIDENPQSLLKRLSVRGEGALKGDIKVNVTGALLYKKAIFNYQTPPDRTGVGNSNTSYNFAVIIPVDFVLPRVQEGFITFLNPQLFSEVSFELEWGNINCLVYGGAGGTSSLSNVKCLLFAEQVLDADVNEITSIYKEIVISKDTINDTQDERIELVTGNYVVDTLIRSSVSVGTSSNPSDFIRNLSLEIDDSKLLEYRSSTNDGWAMLKGLNKSEYALPEVITGYGMIDFRKTGNLDDILDLRNVQSSRAYYKFDLAGASGKKVEILQSILAPLG